MHSHGRIERWYPERGFGFIRGPQGDADLFFRLGDFRGADLHPPKKGMEVSFASIEGSKGMRAHTVQPLDMAAAFKPPRPAAPRRRPPAFSPVRATLGMVFTLAYGASLVWGVWAGRLPWWVLAISWVLNLTSFFLYWKDKVAVDEGMRRGSDDAMLLWGLAGGWPSAWVAQQVLRHRPRKPSFRILFWLTVAMHCAAMAAWLGWPAPLRLLPV